MTEPVLPVLLVDDDPMQLRIREAVLHRGGFQVAVATSAESALALLRGTPNAFSVIVTDHVLPGASGAEFVRMLRDADPVIPVVVVTGLAEAQSEYAGLGVYFREKPFDAPELIALVKSITEEHAQRRGA